MSLRLIGLVFMIIGALLEVMFKSGKRNADATNDESPDNPQNSPIYTKIPRVILIIGAVLTIISVMTGR